jgi:hypothetical protein
VGIGGGHGVSRISHGRGGDQAGLVEPLQQLGRPADVRQHAVPRLLHAPLEASRLLPDGIVCPALRGKECLGAGPDGQEDGVRIALASRRQVVQLARDVLQNSE